MNRTVIIPALNPDDNLQQLTEELVQRTYHVIIVDDGSDEAYQPLFRKLNSQCVVLHHTCNRGKGAAIKTAMQYITKALPECTWIGTMDADGQHLTIDLDGLFKHAEQMPGTLVLGVRTVDEQMPWISRMGNLITRTVFQILTKQRISDTQTGLRVFSYDLLVPFLSISGDRYEYEMNVLLACAREQIPVAEKFLFIRFITIRKTAALISERYGIPCEFIKTF